MQTPRRQTLLTWNRPRPGGGLWRQAGLGRWPGWRACILRQAELVEGVAVHSGEARPVDARGVEVDWAEVDTALVSPEGL